MIQQFQVVTASRDVTLRQAILFPAWPMGESLRRPPNKSQDKGRVWGCVLYYYLRYYAEHRFVSAFGETTLFWQRVHLCALLEIICVES